MRYGSFLPFVAAIGTAALSADSSPPAAVSTKMSPAAAAAVRRVLGDGFAPGRNKLNAARIAWQQIAAADRKNPRVDFAWGLSLHKHRRTRDAERVFQSLAGKSPTYWPARQAVIWMRFARSQHAEGLKGLRAFIVAVADEKSADAAASRPDAAEWSGRVVAALQRIPLPARDKATADNLHDLAEKTFRGPTLAAYQKGREAVKRLSSELSVEAVKTRIQASKQLDAREKQGRKEIASQKNDIDKSQESLKLTAEQWKDWLDERTKQAKRTLARAAKEMAVLEARRASISRSMLLATRQKTAVLAQMRLQRDAGANQASNLALGQIEQTLLTYNNQQLATTQQMNAVRQSAATAIIQYRADAGRYEAATGRIAATNATLSKLETNLKDRDRKLRRKSVGKTTAVRQSRKLRASFTTYVPFDPDAERKRLLESLTD